MIRIFTIVLLFSSLFLNAQVTADFENFNLQVDSFSNNAGAAGGFTSGNIFLPNTNTGFWTDWAVSATTDVTTPGFMNDLSAISGGGAESSNSYAVASAFSPVVMKLENEAAGKPVEGLFLNNGTYGYLSMLEGDGFAKKFGGLTGDEPDFFLLTIKKYLNGDLSTDSVDFYLADFRFADNAQDYIVTDWTYLELAGLGDADSLQFSLSSSDVGNFGMNTPAYFFIDNVTTAGTPVAVKNLAPQEVFEIFPNPTADVLFLKNKTGQIMDCEIYNMMGQLFYNNTFTETQQSIDLQDLAKGTYLIKVQTEEGRASQLFVKE